MPLDFRYPRYDLDQSLDVARKITDRGTGATLTGHELAAFLGYSGVNNGAYLNRIAAARLFGLVDGRADAIRATDRAEAIIHPDYPATEDRARLDAFRSVPLFGAFLDAFSGRDLPDEQGMLNALVGRFKIPQGEARRALTHLLASAEQAGLFRVAGSARMIEPSQATAPKAASTAQSSEPPRQAPMPVPDPGSRRFPKIIDGALDLMPAGAPWEESDYLEWLAFFDQACRVYYRVKRGVTKPTDE